MTVVSKYLDEAIIKYEKLGFSKQALSRGIVSVAVAAYIAHVSYPHVSRLLKAAKLTPSVCETSASTSDDDDTDSDFDEDTDEYEHSHGGGNQHTVTDTRRKDNNNTVNKGQQTKLDNDETVSGCEGETEADALLTVPSGKRKRKHSKVIKQQIKQAEKLLAEADRERKKSAKGGPLSLSQLEEQRIGLNVEFLLKLKRLIKIMIPKLWSREVGILGVHTVCLISRTFLSIYVAAIEGSIVKYIVRKDLRQFVIGLLKWFGIAIPATFINSMIRYLENKLALSFR